MKINLVTSFYNNSQYFDEISKSVEEAIKLYPNTEWVVTDDFDKSDIGITLKKYQLTNYHTKVITQNYKQELYWNPHKFCDGDIIVGLDADDVLMPDALWYINHIYTRFPDVHNLHFSTKFYKDSFEWNNYHNTSMVDYKDYESFVEYHKDYELNKSIAGGPFRDKEPRVGYVWGGLRCYKNPGKDFDFLKYFPQEIKDYGKHEDFVKLSVLQTLGKSLYVNRPIYKLRRHDKQTTGNYVWENNENYDDNKFSVIRDNAPKPKYGFEKGLTLCDSITNSLVVLEEFDNINVVALKNFPDDFDTMESLRCTYPDLVFETYVKKDTDLVVFRVNNIDDYANVKFEIDDLKDDYSIIVFCEDENFTHETCDEGEEKLTHIKMVKSHFEKCLWTTYLYKYYWIMSVKESKKYNFNVRLETSFIGTTGYNNHARDHFTKVDERVPVKIGNFTIGKGWKGMSNDPHKSEPYMTHQISTMLDQQYLWNKDKQLIKEPMYQDKHLQDGRWDKNEDEVYIVLNEANHHLFYQDHPNNIPKIAFNVWETTRYEDSFFKKLLEFDQLWLPSEWAKQCVIEQGYPEEKVQIVTEGVDGQTFYPKKVEESDRFKFIIFGRWDYRKCTKELIQTFLNTFGMDEKVDLIISVDNPFSIDGLESTEERLKHFGLEDDRIKVLHFPSREEYINYIQQGNVFLSCARSEGWNLPLIEALACGTPSICSNWGAQLQFAKDYAHLVDIIDERPAVEGEETFNYKAPGNYCEPDFDHLGKVMRDVYENYTEYKEKAIHDSVLLRNEFQWKRVANKSLDVMQNLINTFDSNMFKVELSKNEDNLDKIEYSFGTELNDVVVSIKDSSTNLTIYHCKYDKVDSNVTYWVVPNSYVDFEEIKMDFEIEVYSNGELYTSKKIGYGSDKQHRYFHNSPTDNNWYNFYEMNHMKIYEKELFVNDESVVIDVGGSCGVFTDYVLNKGATQVFCFEPVPDTYEDLLKTFEDEPNVTIINEAVTTHDYKVDINIPRSATSVSTIELDDAKHHESVDNLSQNFFDDYETITVDGCNFDEYLKKFRNVDVVKFDVEGHEYSIFENLSDENIQKVNQWVIEWHFNYDGGKIDKIYYRLKELGYDVKLNQTSSTEDGYLNNSSGILFAKKYKEKKEKVIVDFIDGCKVEILDGDSKDDYLIHFIDKDNKVPTEKIRMKTNHWYKPGRHYFINWRVVVYRNKELIHTEDLDLNGKNVTIQFDSKSLGDTIAWFPYVEEFRKKHKCNVYVSTFKNFLFQNNYKDINYLEPGQYGDNTYASYHIGWYKNDKGEIDLARNKQDFRKIPLQKSATEILGLDFVEIKPKVKL